MVRIVRAQNSLFGVKFRLFNVQNVLATKRKTICTRIIRFVTYTGSVQAVRPIGGVEV